MPTKRCCYQISLMQSVTNWFNPRLLFIIAVVKNMCAFGKFDLQITYRSDLKWFGIRLLMVIWNIL